MRETLTVSRANCADLGEIALPQLKIPGSITNHP
jgi:hypothetical protein